jgi:hypothetical protein
VISPVGEPAFLEQTGLAARHHLESPERLYHLLDLIEMLVRQHRDEFKNQ